MGFVNDEDDTTRSEYVIRGIYSNLVRCGWVGLQAQRKICLIEENVRLRGLSKL